ncbi:haloacid dehalogenase superfamily, subfamily IA, variant 3 with third motif having DD or ED [Ferrimonas sediminum]|uniref:Haloacid dehalogenase superfamily, subfamily IA, variant 3 with third motif having DD or ED n=1 Tax=Ferrimonas sediminum TaxID=718193 RepID=A0A1G8LCD4_9GAMM|nr:HAD family phosphatase [Ferrimonas sediminum]SDI53276.1 haloacid dehalogenase superfamily, subfamily IA, variant 3 with third motif having DD or ED [Ferrimonas sediminum]
MTYQAAIFDMDGLLLDTERLCMRIFQQACETQQLPFYEEVYLSIIGRNAAGIERIFRQAYGKDLDRLHEEWRCRYHAVVEHQAIPIKPGVVELLEWLKSKGIATAVATSTAKEVARKKLTLAGLDRYFDVLATGCEVSQGKPNPEIYLLAATRLNVAPAKCLAFEDSNNGVHSAVAAEMITYQIPDLVNPSDEVLAFGHTVLPSMVQVLDDLKQRQ